ncbi:hypothetical protein ZWY2020_058647 [Hordeum vulgare]|nr:hypothetical protein ZWY2020_058647 [Hordeum vulgare]
MGRGASPVGVEVVAEGGAVAGLQEVTLQRPSWPSRMSPPPSIRQPAGLPGAAPPASASPPPPRLLPPPPPSPSHSTDWKTRSQLGASTAAASRFGAPLTSRRPPLPRSGRRCSSKNRCFVSFPLVETMMKIDDYGNPIKRTRLAITVSNFDIIGPEFWGKHENILREGKGPSPTPLLYLYCAQCHP